MLGRFEQKATKTTKVGFHLCFLRFLLWVCGSLFHGWADKRLNKLKLPGESFSDVLLRELPDPVETAGELLSYYEKHGVPKANPKLRDAMLKGTGRRSRRP